MNLLEQSALWLDADENLSKYFCGFWEIWGVWDLYHLCFLYDKCMDCLGWRKKSGIDSEGFVDRKRVRSTNEKWEERVKKNKVQNCRKMWENEGINEVMKI